MDGACEYLGAVRIKDGLFLGDALSAWDVDFLTSNGVECVVNCTPAAFEYNLEEVCVLQLPWPEDGDVALMDASGQRLSDEVQRLIEVLRDAEARGVSSLIHSRRGRSRAVLAVCLFLMVRFFWTAQKALEFVLSRRPDLQLRRQFIIQLLHIEKLLRSCYSLSSDWDVNSDSARTLSGDELLLRNTFRNSLQLSADAAAAATRRPASAASGTTAPAAVSWLPGDVERVIKPPPPRLEDESLDIDPDEDDEDSLSVEIASPEHVITPRDRSDANMHWVVPTRGPAPPELCHKKTSQDLNVEIPLTVHPALRATRNLPPISPARIPRGAFRSFPPPPTWKMSLIPPPRLPPVSKTPQNIWPSIAQMSMPPFPPAPSPPPAAESPPSFRKSPLAVGVKSFSMSRISAPPSLLTPSFSGAPSFTKPAFGAPIHVSRRYTDAGTWNPQYAPTSVRSR